MDINSPKTQKEYGYCLIKPIDLYKVVLCNYQVFEEKSNLGNPSDKFDEGYKAMDINIADKFNIYDENYGLEIERNNKSIEIFDVNTGIKRIEI